MKKTILLASTVFATFFMTSVALGGQMLKCQGKVDEPSTLSFLLIGEALQGEKLYFGETATGEFSGNHEDFIHFVVEEVVEDNVKKVIIGETTNQAFIGSGSQTFELEIPKVRNSTAVLYIHTTTLYFEKEDRIELNCGGLEKLGYFNPVIIAEELDAFSL